MKRIILICVILGISWTARAQEMVIIDNAEFSAPEWRKAYEAMMSAYAAVGAENWTPVNDKVSGAEAGTILEDAGWPETTWQTMVAPEQSYQMFKRSDVPGAVDFLLVPESGDPALQFDAARFAPAVVAGPDSPFFEARAQNSALTEANYLRSAAQSIRAELMRQLDAVLQTMCEMPARPTTFRAKATAYLIEVEGTWETAEACEAS